MTHKELLAAVWLVVDGNCMKMSKTEYMKFLDYLSSDASFRSEAVRHEIENDGE